MREFKDILRHDTFHYFLHYFLSTCLVRYGTIKEYEFIFHAQPTIPFHNPISKYRKQTTTDKLCYKNLLG